MARRSRARLLGAVIEKELKEGLRDTNVLLFSFGVPLLLYPLLSWGGIQLAMLEDGVREQDPPRVFAQGPDDLVEAFSEEPFRALAAGELDLVLIESGGPGGEVEVLHRSNLPRSAGALALAEGRLGELRGQRAQGLAALLGDPSLAEDPWSIEPEDVSPPGRFFASLMGLILPATLISSLILSGLYPAAEAITGERERGTLETTLVAAAPRRWVALGKVVAVSVMMGISILGNAVGMALTTGSLLASLSADAERVPLDVDLSQLLVAVPVMASAMLAVVGLLLLSMIPAKTLKEATTLGSASTLLFLLPSLGLVVGQAELTLGAATLPVGNAALILRDALSAEGAAPHLALLAAAVNLSVALGTISLAAALLGRESTLFGERPRWLSRLLERGR
jgi:sodium transport system permease protein